ncbi:MAG: 50S ribosomal protein L17 [Candidatus Yanofskybacteria bacterium CG10_big_fil_rev_8_21_14_0_10_37_15]|uniref:50S ribosomal protein L17 n=1 Tax=Candidatus Yanofskybacteria bacterium CG10_big_fil_rev_8_21_14_0_10_37_15 TaxID=1975097 RepID=A0A2H0R5X0_9BACT|nr:MAG: 50S ribosomal protein L17 [Candidatus Yanofskybacteria bacterium CG10_big_fil_rev_8_21_14_0_10_37_15]
MFITNLKRGKHRKFGRKTKQRKALYKSLATALIENKKIKTTSAKAKSLSGHFEKMITIAKKQTLASRRLLQSQIGNKALKTLFSEIASDMKDKKGGYTRIISLGQRKSDGAEMSIIELSK